MPWSEWIQSDPYERGTTPIYVAATQAITPEYSAGDLATVYAMSLAGDYTDNTTTVFARGTGAVPGILRQESAQNQPGGVPPWLGGIVQNQAVSWFTTDQIELETWREWFPPEMYDLTEGVDYELRPDRTGSEDDAFVQYEDGAADLTGWQCFISAHISSVVDNEDYHATVKWRLLSPPPSYPATPAPGTSEVAGVALVVEPDSGVSMVEIVDGVAGQTTPVTFDIGPVTAFAVAAVPDDTSDPAIGGDTGAGYDAFLHRWVATGAPIAWAYVRLPRWRYWIPGEPALQQVQRDDGRGIAGTPGWRTRSSRQASNAWRGYL